MCLTLTLSPLKTKTDRFCICRYTVEWVHVHRHVYLQVAGVLLCYMTVYKYMNELPSNQITQYRSFPFRYYLLSFPLWPFHWEHLCHKNTPAVYNHGMVLWIKASIRALHLLLNEIHWMPTGERNIYTSLVLSDDRGLCFALSLHYLYFECSIDIQTCLLLCKCNGNLTDRSNVQMITYVTFN